MKTAFLLFFMSLSSFAGQGKEGGTPHIVRTNLDKANYNKIYNEINNLVTKPHAKRRIIYIIKSIPDHKWNQFDFKFSKYDLIEDIKKSKYYKVDGVSEKCVDKYGKSKFATAKSMNRNGRICFDLSKVLDNGHLISGHEFLAILFHEHLHHFGIEDKDHKIGTKLASFGSHLPLNIVHGSCQDNLKNDQDSFNYRVYADDFGLSSFENTEKWYFDDFKKKAITVAKNIFNFSGCVADEVKMKPLCQKIFIKENNGFKSYDYICKIDTQYGYMYMTQDMLGYMNVNFNRWD